MHQGVRRDEGEISIALSWDGMGLLKSKERPTKEKQLVVLNQCAFAQM